MNLRRIPVRRLQASSVQVLCDPVNNRYERRIGAIAEYNTSEVRFPQVGPAQVGLCQVSACQPGR